MPIGRGYKQLSKVCGGACKKTLLKWITQYKLPLVRLGNMITFDEDLIREWHSNLRKKFPDDGKFRKTSLNFHQRLSKK